MNEIETFVKRLEEATWDHSVFIKRGGDTPITVIEFSDDVNSTLESSKAGGEMFRRAGYVAFEAEMPTMGQMQGMIMLVGHLNKEATIEDASDHWRRLASIPNRENH